MELSFLLGRQVVVQFLMLFVGFIIIRLKVFKPEDATVISKLTLYVFLPCLTITSFFRDFSGGIASQLLLTFTIALATNIIFITLPYLLKKPFRLNKIERLSLSYPNCANLVMPLVAATLGSDWLIYACIYSLVQIVFLFTHCRSVMLDSKGFDPKQIFLNINIISAAVGFIITITHIPVPQIFRSVIFSFSGLVAPCSMIVIGMAIGQADLLQIFRTGRIYFICFLRLIALPMIIISFIKITGVTYLFEGAKEILLITVICCSSSVATTITQFAQAFGQDSSESSKINVMSVLFLIITLPSIITIYQMWI